MYKVIDVETGESFGPYDDISQAKACTNAIADWEIWDECDICVLSSIQGTW